VLEYLLWNETAFPCNWARDGREEDLRLQLATIACRELYGELGYWDAERSLEDAGERYAKMETRL
jgi:hypothetical protein